MNVLFLTISGMPNYNRHDIYADILLSLVDHGYHVYSISSNQRRNGNNTTLREENGIHALRVRTGNITNCGLIEKGISTVRIKHQYIAAIKHYFSHIKFDLVLYATPPITLDEVVKFVKKRDGAKTYLMLKDIFPQNAIDLGMMSKTGLKGVLYRYFRNEEKRLYHVSDRIGCMSPANVNFLLQENSDLDETKVDVFPNCLDPLDLRVDEQTRYFIRGKYQIPQDKTVFVYGGNLGLPQGIPFIIDCVRAAAKETEAFFLIVGGGTEFAKLSAFVEKEKPSNVKLLDRIPKDDYDCLVAACDVGLIFLDHRFQIPNFPSRLLSYLQAGLPVLCATDPNTDIGRIAKENGFGWWCESDDTNAFLELVRKALSSNLEEKGVKGYLYMRESYDVSVGYALLEKFMRQ